MTNNNNYLVLTSHIDYLIQTQKPNRIEATFKSTRLSLHINGVSELVLTIADGSMNHTHLSQMLSDLVSICKKHPIRTIRVHSSSKEIQKFCKSNHFRLDPLKKFRLRDEVIADYIFTIK